MTHSNNSFQKLSRILIVLLLVFGPLFFASTVHAAEYTVTLNQDHFDVSYHVLAWQNITGYCKGCPKLFPEQVNYSLNSTELARFTNTMQTALQHSVPTITINQASVRISSTNASDTCSPVCPRQWFNVTMNFQVHETPSSTMNNIARYDMSWKAIAVNDSLMATGIEYNKVGLKYLIPGYTPIVNSPSQAGRSLTVTFGSTTVTNATYQIVGKSIVMLDLSRARIPLDNWTLTPDITAQRNVWTSPRSGGFFTFVDQKIESTDFFYFAEARITAQIYAPLNTYSKGDSLYQDTSNGLSEKIQLSIVLATVGTLAATIVIDRRLSVGQGIKRKIRKK